MPLSANIRSEAESSAASQRVFPYAVAVFLLPILVLWHRDDALFSPLWQSDPWFYLGYFKNLVNFKRDLFPGLYHGSRLAWILPGYLAHFLLPPVVANAVLHLAVHSIASLSLFSILRWTIGLRTAYLTAMIFSLHPWLWCATGWDHVNGAAIAYYLLAMALLTRGALRPPSRACLILAGMALAGSVYSHFFLVAFAPLLVLAYMAAGGHWSLKQAIHALSVLVPWMGVGFAAVTLSLCAINYFFVDGEFWFFSPSLRSARDVMSNYVWTESIVADQKLVPWLWFILMGSATAIVLIPLSLRDGLRKVPGLMFAAQLLLAAGLMAYLQSRGVTLLGHYYYACYLLPFVFLVAGVAFFPGTEKMGYPAYVATCLIATLLFGALWYHPAAHPFSRWRIPEWLELVSAALILPVGLALRQRKSGVFLALAGIAILTSAGYTGSYRYVELHGNHAAYVRIMQARQRVEYHRRDAPILFWYDRQELPAYFEYQALNATYMAELSRISEAFPEGCNAAAAPGTLVVVTSQKEHSTELARSTLTNCWQTFRIRPVIESVESIQSEGKPYTMTMLRVEPTASSQPPPGELFETIPLERVTPGDAKAVLRRTSEGLRVDTIPGYGAFAGRIDLGLDPGLRLKLSVLVRLRVLEGKIGVGVLDTKNKAFLLNLPLWPSTFATDVLLPLPSPPITGPVIISNVSPKKGISKAVVEKIEIRKLP